MDSGGEKHSHCPEPPFFSDPAAPAGGEAGGAEEDWSWSWAGWLRFCALLLAPGLTFNLLAFQYLGLFDVMGHFVQLSPTTGYSLSAAEECEEFHGEEDETFHFPSGGNHVWAGDIVMFSIRRQLPALGACTLSFHLAKTFSFGL